MWGNKVTNVGGFEKIYVMEKVQLKKVCGMMLHEWENFLVKYEKSRHVYMCHCGCIFSSTWKENHVDLLFLAMQFLVITKNRVFIVHTVFLFTAGFECSAVVVNRKQIRIEFLNYIIQNFETL